MSKDTSDGAALTIAGMAVIVAIIWTLLTGECWFWTPIIAAFLVTISVANVLRGK